MCFVGEGVCSSRLLPLRSHGARGRHVLRIGVCRVDDSAINHSGRRAVRTRSRRRALTVRRALARRRSRTRPIPRRTWRFDTRASLTASVGAAGRRQPDGRPGACDGLEARRTARPTPGSTRAIFTAPIGPSGAARASARRSRRGCAGPTRATALTSGRGTSTGPAVEPVHDRAATCGGGAAVPNGCSDRRPTANAEDVPVAGPSMSALDEITKRSRLRATRPSRSRILDYNASTADLSDVTRHCRWRVRAARPRRHDWDGHGVCE